MKRIDNREDKWRNNILRDLNYIKRYHRYPWKNGMKTPLFVAVSWALVAVVSFLFEMTISKTDNAFIQYLLPLSSLSLAVLSIVSYLKSLKFTDIKTDLDKHLNRQLAYSFLQQRQLLIYEHPECPDILQILSRPVNINSAKREVLVFIAAEGHILVNSHFTDNRWIILLKNRHDKTMAKSLSQYIMKHKTQPEIQLKKLHY